ncbi:MAG: hypothetical protein RBS43_05840 [Candidatus Cloacimonas sp.]|jgi:hypothetical protein|nr:hypothetical protein [Candidatus Cloacimonas sp.]
MKKGLLGLAFVLLVLTNLMAVSHFGLTANGFEPSAINMALGGSPVGVVNFWHNDPLNAYDNPAFPALKKGLSFSNNSYAFMGAKDSDIFDDLEYSSALSSLSYYGLGLLLPFVNYKTSENNSYVDYGNFSVADEETFDPILFHAYDQISTYGFSVNLSEAYRLIKSEANLLPYNADLALGMNMIGNCSHITPYPYQEKVKANSTNLGLLARIDHINDSNLRLESAYGLSYFNGFNNKVTFVDWGQEDLIYQRLNLGVSASLARKNSAFPVGKGIRSSVENIGTVRLLAGAIDELSDNPLLLGFGGELGLLDTVFFRMGHYDDKDGNISGLTYGLGINLHYREMISAVYNYAYFPGGSVSKGKTANSLSLNVDLLGIINDARIRLETR